MQPIAFVIPWYGENIPGGAESLCRNVVHNLHAKGINVKVLTTCVKEFSSDWNTNHYKPGQYLVDNVPVMRFKVRKRDSAAFDYINSKLMNNILVSLEEEEVFFNEMINSPSLYEYIKSNQYDYHCFVFIPYMFGTTYWGIKQCPEKGVLLPCFHDESYAHMKLIKEMTNSAAGVIFNSEPEADLATKIYNISGKTEIIGMGIETEYSYDTDSIKFREKYKINSDFILYAGRKDKGKNVDQLIEYFINYKKKKNKNDIKLLLIGGGTIFIPDEYTGSIIDLGFVPAEDKLDAYSSASVFCNPSKNESFSIVIMESWLMGTPILVNSQCEVTRNFCIDSSGGLYYKNSEEFIECLDIMLTNKELSSRMGLNGKKYVEDNYSWDVIINKYIKFFCDL